jgi:hypothetical protein
LYGKGCATVSVWALHGALETQPSASLREQGLIPIEFWVPDVNSPEFAAEARRQSLLIANSPEEKNDQAFIDSISVSPFDEE